MELFHDLFGDNTEPWMKDSKCGTDKNFLNTQMTYAEWQTLHRETDFFASKGPFRDKAKKYCGDCPVRLECHMYANQMEVESEQIYGGLTNRERRAIQKKTNKLLAEWLEQMPEPQQDDESPNAA